MGSGEGGFKYKSSLIQKRMLHKFENEFYLVCGEIIKESKTVSEWAEIESDDMFQEGIYNGGFDAIEMEFCFSVYLSNVEYWFQLSLDSVTKVLEKIITEVEIRKAG